MSVDNLDKGALFANFFEDDVRTAKISMTNEQVKSISFVTPFSGDAPFVIVTPTQNVRLYLRDVTISGFDVTASAAFTGDIHYQAWQ